MLPKSYRSDADIRRQQINTLKIFNEHVLEVCEGREYKVMFKAGRHELCLDVSLSNDFPKEKPVLKVSPAVAHAWVNGEGEVTAAPGLLNFTVHSDLGRVVQAIIRELERNPPNLAGELPEAATASVKEAEMTSPGFVAASSFSPPPPSQSYGNTAKLALFPELSRLSTEELEFLNGSPDRLQEFLNEVPLMREQSKTLDDCILQVEELAESNLSKRGELEELRASISERIEEVAKLAFENERLHVKYQDLSDNFCPANIKAQLQAAAQQAETESEKVAEGFLRGDMDVEQFVPLYTKVRKLCQMRKTKEEKLAHQLDRLERAGF